MEQEFHIPTEVLNDANAAALGEAWIGAAKGKKDVVVVTIGTGVGGGILMNGKILLGTSGFAGELGHIPVQYEGEMCTCGNRGCLEHYGSTSALVRKVRWAIQEGAIAGAADTPVDGRWIFAQAATGNVVVQKILQEWNRLKPCPNFKEMENQIVVLRNADEEIAKSEERNRMQMEDFTEEMESQKKNFDELLQSMETVYRHAAERKK